MYHIGFCVVLQNCSVYGMFLPCARASCEWYTSGVRVVKQAGKEKRVNKNTDSHKEDEVVVGWPVVFAILALMVAVYNLESFMW